MPNLSKRLSVIASLVPFGARVCDIGTDHAFLAIELVKSGKASSVIATDINEKPLKKARENIAKSGDCEIDLRLCDGLADISPSEVDTVVIAGMGGEVISGILERGKEVAARKGVKIILSPTTSHELLRKFLYANGFSITNETAVEENNKLYSVMEVRFATMSEALEEYFYYVGRLVPNTREAVLYIKKQRERCFSCAKSLENIAQKAKDYEYYTSVYKAIDSYLDSYRGE